MRNVISSNSLCIAFVSVVWLSGCSSTPRTYSIPQHIDFDVARGLWSVATAGQGTKEQLPDWIKVYSTWKGERREGVWIVPESPAAGNLLIAAKRGYSIGPEDYGLLVEVPNYIEPFGKSWTVVTAEKRIGAYMAELEVKDAYALSVPVRRSRGQLRGPEAGIEKQSNPR